MANRAQEEGDVSLSYDANTGKYYVGYTSGQERHKHAMAHWPGGTREEAELTQFCDAMGLPLDNVHNRIPAKEKDNRHKYHVEIDLP